MNDTNPAVLKPDQTPQNETKPKFRHRQNSHTSDLDQNSYIAKRILYILQESQNFKMIPSSKFYCPNHPKIKANYFSITKKEQGHVCVKCAFLSETVNFQDCNKFLNEKELKNKNLINSFYKNFLKVYKKFDSFKPREEFAFELASITENIHTSINSLKEECIEIIEKCFEKVHDKIEILAIQKSEEYEKQKHLYAKMQNSVMDLIVEVESNYEKYLFRLEGANFTTKINHYSEQLKKLSEVYIGNVIEIHPNLNKLTIGNTSTKDFLKIVKKFIKSSVSFGKENVDKLQNDLTIANNSKFVQLKVNQITTNALEMEKVENNSDMEKEISFFGPSKSDVLSLKMEEYGSLKRKDVDKLKGKNHRACSTALLKDFSSINSEDWFKKIKTDSSFGPIERISHNLPSEMGHNLTDKSINNLLQNQNNSLLLKNHQIPEFQTLSEKDQNLHDSKYYDSMIINNLESAKASIDLNQNEREILKKTDTSAIFLEPGAGIDRKNAFLKSSKQIETIKDEKKVLEENDFKLPDKIWDRKNYLFNDKSGIIEDLEFESNGNLSKTPKNNEVLKSLNIHNSKQEESQNLTFKEKKEKKVENVKNYYDFGRMFRGQTSESIGNGIVKRSINTPKSKNCYPIVDVNHNSYVTKIKHLIEAKSSKNEFLFSGKMGSTFRGELKSKWIRPKVSIKNFNPKWKKQLKREIGLISKESSKKKEIFNINQITAKSKEEPLFKSRVNFEGFAMKNFQSQQRLDFHKSLTYEVKYGRTDYGDKWQTITNPSGIQEIVLTSKDKVQTKPFNKIANIFNRKNPKDERKTIGQFCQKTQMSNISSKNKVILPIPFSKFSGEKVIEESTKIKTPDVDN